MTALATYLGKAQSQPTRQDLEEVLNEIARFGRPRLSMMDARNWVCVVKMNTGTVSSSFEIRSEFDHTDPLSAALQCRDRIKTAITTIGGAA